MRKINYIATASFMIMLFCFCSGITPSYGSEALEIRFKGAMITASIEDAPLGQILEMLVIEKGIWLKWKQSLYNEKISIQFKDMPLEKCLARLLSKMNYAFMYDHNKQLVGLTILGKKGTGGSFTQGGVTSNPFKQSTSASSPGNDRTELNLGFKGHPFPQTDQKVADINEKPLFGVSKPLQNSDSNFEILPH
jgi:hypothetical protein